MRPVILPILEANMTHGVVLAWRKREGDTVQAGEVLFEVETDKVNAEVEAEVSGILRHIAVPVGTRVPVLSVLAFVGAAEEALPDAATRDALAAPKDGGVVVVPTQAEQGLEPGSRVAASPSARRLARERGVALEDIRGSGPRGEIRRADVEAMLATGPAAVAPASVGRLDPAFLQMVRNDTAFRNLESAAKVHLYRQHGAHIGEAVRIDKGAIILAAEIVLGAGASIGADSTIECKRLQLGRLAALGKRTRVRCRAVEIGDALWAKDDVVIGGGGSDEPEARLRAGDACFFGEGAYLNASHPLMLGDEVCIGSRAMLFTHSHWQSVLRGYASLFGPITIGDHAFVGNNAFVFPGVTIGSGATIMVNSFVALNVPPATFVGGVPAQVIRHIAMPSRSEQIDIARQRLMPDLAAALRGQGYSVTLHAEAAVLRLDVGTIGTICFAPEWKTAEPASARTVILTFMDAEPVGLDATVTLFDLAGSRVHGMQDTFSDEVRELCRRRGIRFRPYAWRHGVGHIDGEHLVRR